MKFSRLVSVLLFGSLICSGQVIRPLYEQAARVDKPQAFQIQGTEYVIPELIIGGEWTSVIKMTNRGTSAIPTTNVFFYDDAGNPMRATFQVSNGNIITDTGFSFSLSPGTMLEATFTAGSAPGFGHGVIACSSAGCNTPGLYGDVTLRNRNSTRPDFESVFAFERPVPLQYMLFDGRSGYSTVLYIVNENTSFSNVAIDVVDPGNRLVRTVNLSFGPFTTQILTLGSLVPETLGIQGTLVIRGQNSNGALITVTALRINPSNSFTPVRAWIP